MTLIYFIIILGTIVLIHEFGHFIFAKKAGIYCYEFSLGMGPKLFSFKPKNSETTYSIRLVPLGGFVSMAGEDVEEDESIPKDRRLQSKTWFQKFLTIFAGPLFNFILAFILLIVVSLISGATMTKPIIGDVRTDSPAYKAGLDIGNEIVSIAGKKVKNWDQAMLRLQLINNDKPVSFEVINNNGNKETIKIAPEKKVDGDDVSYYFGIGTKTEKKHGIINALSYSWSKVVTLTESMFVVIGGLFTGKISLNNLSGPVGIYGIVGEQAKAGFDSILYLIAYLSINVGFINLIPFPAFDGGRILFLFIEKIIGRPVSPKVENMMHNIGFFLLIGLMLLITFNDILKL